MDLKERAEVMAKQEEAMRVSFNLERKVTQSAKTESSFNDFLLLMFSGSFCDRRLPPSRLPLAKLGTSLNHRRSPSSTSGRTCGGNFFKFSIFFSICRFLILRFFSRWFCGSRLNIFRRRFTENIWNFSLTLPRTGDWDLLRWSRGLGICSSSFITSLFFNLRVTSASTGP